LIFIEGIFEAFPNRRQDFVNLALQTMAASQLEKGCSLYRFTADLEDPTHFTLTELWGYARRLESSPHW
jgi:quinol monooxygenase YgiN